MGKVHLEILPAVAESLGMEGKSEEEIPDSGNQVGRTVRDLLNHLADRNSRFRHTVFDTDTQRLSGKIIIFLNGHSLESVNGLDTELVDGDTLVLVPLIEGG